MQSLQRGMTWLELALVAGLLGVVGVVMLHRLADYQELAERADMEYGVATLKSALRIRVGVLMVEGRLTEKRRLLCENPVLWLERQPANYAGEAHGAAVKNVSPGHWYYDPVECVIAYVARNSRHLAPDSTGMARVRFQVRADAEDTAGRPGGLSLVPVEPYRWESFQ